MASDNNLQIRLAGPEDKQSWDAYALSHPDGLAYHLFAWKEAVEQAYGFECPYCLAEQDGNVCGVLPTAHVHWPLRPGSLVSLPYCDVGGILADSDDIASSLLRFACEHASEHGIPTLELRLSSSFFLSLFNHKIPPSPHNSSLSQSATRNSQLGISSRFQNNTTTQSFNNSSNLQPTSYNIQQTTPIHPPTPLVQPSQLSQPPQHSFTASNQQTHKVRMLLSLPETSKALMSSFKSKLRSQVRKPGREGLSAALGGLDLVDEFYPVFAENMRDLGSPVHSRKWIQSILQAYGSRARSGLVLMPDGSPAACGIILLHDRTVSIPWASSLRKFNKSSPNMLLYWTFLEYAADHGYAFFDFGRSTPGEGTYKFKEQWGAAPQPLHWVRIDSGTGGVEPIGGAGGGQKGQDKPRQMAETLIRSIPVPLATLLGSRVRKYISL